MIQTPPESGSASSSGSMKRPIVGFRQLLYALALLLFLSPFIGQFDYEFGKTLATALMGSLLAFVLVAAALAVSENRRQIQITVIFATVCLGIMFPAHLLESRGLRIVQSISTIGFLIYVVRLIVRHLFRVRSVDYDTIAASLCGYLLIGVAFAAVFSVVYDMDENALATHAGNVESDVSLQFGGSQTATSLYFSFVTLTTLGYGDITPVSRPARMLATAEALIGQLYLVVLVARLVGLHIADDR